MSKSNVSALVVLFGLSPSRPCGMCCSGAIMTKKTEADIEIKQADGQEQAPWLPDDSRNWVYYDSITGYVPAKKLLPKVEVKNENHQ